VDSGRDERTPASDPSIDAAPPGHRVVFGASGYIGQRLVPRLLSEHLPVRAVARRLSSLQDRGWEGAELVAADALVPDTLPPALAGAEVAYYLVHSMAAGRDFGRLDRIAAGNFARAAAEAGVRRIVYLGGLVPPDASSEHIVSRRETGEELRRGPVPVTELRAGIIVGPGSAAFEVMRDLVYHLPVMVTPRWVRSRSPPIALENLLEYLVRLPAIEEAAGKVYDAAGPETLTYEAMMRILAEAAGRRAPWIIPVPVLSPRLSSYWLRLVTAVPTNVARALIEGLKHDFDADDAALRRLVPQRLLGFRESIDAVFEAERASPATTRWTEGAFALRDHRIDYAYYALRASGSAETLASPTAVWAVVSRIGGDNGYFYLEGLWRLRELMDWAIGGSGHRRGRRDPAALQVGDRVDSWTVLGVEPERRLSLKFGMKAPGAGVFEFEISPRPAGGCRLTATAYWHPAGVWGLLYWYSLAPAHQVIFSGMTREICQRAEAEERTRQAR
jgi:uncharacterized protein YbjT (DUF2867 family)